MEALKVYKISDEYAFMFIGGYESKVHVYSIMLSNCEVEYQTSLAGHSNSIRDFAFTDGFVASCS